MTQCSYEFQRIGAHSVMAPSLLKKMSGSRERVEGNYASSDLFPLQGESSNTDLGLTLLPGSQTQKDNEDSADFVTRSGLIDTIGHGQQRQAARPSRDHQDVRRSGSLENQAPFDPATALIWTEYPGLTNVPDLKFRDGNQTMYRDRSPRPQKRRKLEPQDFRLRSDVTRSESPSFVNVIQRKEDLTGIADPDYVQPPIRFDPVKGRALSTHPMSTSASGSTSVLNSRKFGILLDNSPENLIPHALQITTQPPNSSNTHLEILDPSVSEELKLHDTGSWNSSAISKLLVEIWHSKDSQFTIHGQYLPVDTATKASSQQRSEPSHLTSNTTRSLRQAVLKSTNKATRSWTSHFPEASKSFRARREVRTPATFSAAAASFVRVAGNQRTPSADNVSSTVRIYLKQTALSQSKSHGPLSQTSLLARESGSPSSSHSTHYLLNTTFVGHQQHRSHRRASSLPNLPSRHGLSSMDPTQRYGPSALPTPPTENQPFPYQRPASNSLSSPAAAANMWNGADNGVSDGLNPFTTSSTPIRNGTHPGAHCPHNHYTQQNTFYPTNTLAHHSGSAQHHHLMSDGGFGRSSSQTLLPNGSMTPALQQANGHMMQPKESYSGAEIQDLLNEWHQVWEARYRGRDAAYQSQLSQEKSRSQSLLNENSRLDFESGIMELNLGQLQQELELWKGRVPHDNVELYQRYQSMYNALAHRNQEVAFLQHENGRLQAANRDLISQLEKLAAQPRPNAVVAKNILQTLSKPNAVTIPTPRPYQASLPQEHNTDKASPHQNQILSSYPSSQLERQITTFTTGHVIPQAHFTSPLPTSSVESASFTGQSGSAAHADPKFEGNGVGIERRHIAPAPKLMIDLTNDSYPSSLSEPVDAPPPPTHLPSAHGQFETEQTPADLQAQVAIRTAFNKKELEWMDGLHPGRALHTSGVNFGLPSSKQALAAKAKAGSNTTAKINSKKTKDVMDAVANHDDAQTEQSRNDQDLKKRAKNAASQRKYAGKKRREQEKHSNQSSVVQSSPSQTRKQGRKSAKIHKRQQAASQQLADVHHPSAQYTLDGRPLEEHIEHSPLIWPNAEEQQAGTAGDPLMDDNDDMEIMHFPDHAANEDQDNEMTAAQFQAMLTAEAETDTDSEDGAAKLEAMLIADAEADADSDDDGAAACQAMMEAEARESEAAGNGIENSSAAATCANTDGPEYHDDPGSEVSEVSEEE